ncbi:hypothetical protein Q5P01_022284 [Channa striata]|uniref:small monomeric GTPase n=1 Tax=Channa striata TaxID=64152 RepID=A0AA88IXU3_CHASR|nr:hypothetical protein Q5P01_022284 [Channa striata]
MVKHTVDKFYKDNEKLKKLPLLPANPRSSVHRSRGKNRNFTMASANATYGQKESTDQNFDYMFKILIIGNSSVGKTSFLFRYADDSFTPAFVSTVGIDFKVKTIYRNDKRIKLQIWDTAGQERYRTITTAYYRGAMGFILMYDITNEESFNAVQDWSRRSRHTHGTMLRSSWWGTSVIWRMKEWWLQRGVDSCPNSWGLSTLKQALKTTLM